MEFSDERAVEIDPGLKRMILIEIIFPVALLTLGIYHGLMQVLYRSGMIHSSQFLGLEYYQGLTLHGVVNALVFTTFFAVAFGYAVVRFYLARPLNMTVAWLSFALMVGGTLMAATVILTRNATVLYTFYPPLRAHPAFYIGLTLVVIGSWVAFFNWIPPYLAWKRENPGRKVPLAVVGIFVTFIVWLIATIPLAIETIFLLIPWSIGWVPPGPRGNRHENSPFGLPCSVFPLRPVRHARQAVAGLCVRPTGARFAPDSGYPRRGPGGRSRGLRLHRIGRLRRAAPGFRIRARRRRPGPSFPFDGGCPAGMCRRFAGHTARCGLQSLGQRRRALLAGQRAHRQRTPRRSPGGRHHRPARQPAATPSRSEER